MQRKYIEILSELLKNSKTNDRDLAKKLGISQSTVTRIRHKLEKKDILSYVGIPDLTRLGIHIIAFTFSRHAKPSSKLIKKIQNFIIKSPRIMFSGEGEGMAKTTVIISLHSDFTDYMSFIRSFRTESEGLAESIESFFVPTTMLIKDFKIGKAVESILKEKMELPFDLS